MALLAKVGYGQVEPNRLSAQATKRIIADVPVNATDFATLGGIVENGMFLTYNPAGGIESNLKKGTFDLPTVKGGTQLTGLVYNEVKLYHDSQSNKDFALTTSGHTLLSGVNQTPYRDVSGTAIDTVVPRVYFLAVGDIFTTNLIDEDDPALGDVLVPGTDGILTASTAIANEAIAVQVVQITTLADGQKAVKVAVIKA